MTDLQTRRVIGQLLIMCLSCSAQVLIPGDHNEKTTNRTGLIGAVPIEDLVQKKSITCEGEKLYIACSNIYHKIQILVAFYGREDLNTCRHPELPSDKICAEKNETVLNIVKDLCQGESRCEVAATNDFLTQFTPVVCPNVFKYLYVTFRCVPKGALPDVPRVPLDPYGPGPDSGRALTSVHCCQTGTQSVEERIISSGGMTQGGSSVIETVRGGGKDLQTSNTPLILLGKSENTVNPMINPDKISTPNGTQALISLLELKTRLQAQAKRLGMTNLISTDLPKLGNAIAKPSKRGFIPKSAKFKTKNQWQQQLPLRHVTHGKRFQTEAKKRTLRLNSRSVPKKGKLMSKSSTFGQKNNWPQRHPLKQSEQGESARRKKQIKRIKAISASCSKQTLTSKSTRKARRKSWLRPFTLNQWKRRMIA